eukprot:10799796-Alexandrium_andersonii.AAC.1
MTSSRRRPRRALGWQRGSLAGSSRPLSSPKQRSLRRPLSVRTRVAQWLFSGPSAAEMSRPALGVGTPG